MDYEISFHARLRMEERGISERQIAKTITKPTQVLVDYFELRKAKTLGFDLVENLQ